MKYTVSDYKKNTGRSSLTKRRKKIYPNDENKFLLQQIINTEKKEKVFAHLKRTEMLKTKLI